jgi:serine/threonine-protein kinase ULK/ATG1
VIPIERISNDQKFLELLKREIDIMQKIEHKNIGLKILITVRMYGASRTSRNLYMFIEYCGDGDLKQLLKKNQGVLSESVAK